MVKITDAALTAMRLEELYNKVDRMSDAPAINIKRKILEAKRRLADSEAAYHRANNPAKSDFYTKKDREVK